jgi:tartrate-resistant acid phosphatase type 5
LRGVIVVCFLFLSFSHQLKNSELKFLAFGDWGGHQHSQGEFPHTTPGQRLTARALGAAIRRDKPRFVMSLGDNFYQEGVKSVSDARFNETFERVYDDAAMRDLPWYIIAGNHDHLGSIDAQIQYSRRSARWRFPSEFYVERFAFGANRTAAIIFLDGTLFLAQYMRRPFVMVNKSYGRMLRDFEQLRWLNATLEATRDADWLIVASHNPVMSVAEYPGHPSFITHVQPLLERYRAAFYFSGHSHTMQHLRHNRVNYIVSGCGAAANYNRWNWFNVPPGSLRFCHPDAREADQAASGQFTRPNRGGFASVTIHNATSASFQFTSNTGQVLYAYTTRNPRADASVL